MGQISDEVARKSKTIEVEPLAIEVTPEYEYVKSLILGDHKLIFVTGGAGTGKSTFIKWIEKEFSGQVLIAAPTGIAALTVSGTTIHRLCKFPPAWIVDGDIKEDPRSIASKVRILVIDEISMVNANLLDALDKYFQINRKSTEPFGGVTVLIVGDLFQLPPVVTKITEELFIREYSSPKFFAARAIQNSSLVGIELTTPFRQKDENLIRLLKAVREGIELGEVVEEFNQKCLVTEGPPEGAVHLAPRNRDVEVINRSRLESLAPPEMEYEGKLEGRFSESQLPVANRIRLRIGAQVVLAANGPSWVNGNLAVVEAMMKDKVKIRLIHNNKTLEVPPYKWKQFEYKYDATIKKVFREEIGSYTQIPLSLAWAMTIHKSQGLTLERVHLDLGAGAFETGQTYVALSRSRSLNTITLARRLSISDVKVDAEALSFYRGIRGSE